MSLCPVPKKIGGERGQEPSAEKHFRVLENTERGVVFAAVHLSSLKGGAFYSRPRGLPPPYGGAALSPRDISPKYRAAAPPKWGSI